MFEGFGWTMWNYDKEFHYLGNELY